MGATVSVSVATLISVAIISSRTPKNPNRPKPETAFENKLKSSDSDKDGLNAYEEIYTRKTNPNDPDTDHNGREAQTKTALDKRCFLFGHIFLTA